MRVLLFPVIVVMAAVGFLNLDAGRRAHCYGWIAQKMDEHWARLFNPQHSKYESFFHSGKNVMTEWVRLDPQRAGKMLCFLLCVALVMVAVL